MLGINMNDVLTTLGLLQNHLIAIGICLVLAIMGIVRAAKLSEEPLPIIGGVELIR